MEFDGFGIGERMFFGQKCRSEGGLAIIVEFLVGEAGEDGGLPHSRIPDRDEFDLSDVALFFLCF